MPPVKKPAKPGKPNEPKKPSSRSKTKNAECSQAASTWQLSLRGKATATAETYQTLAKCRALASSQRKADSYGRTGKLSEQGKTALESRLQSRFESGLITDKSRKAKLADLLAKRKAAQQRRNDGATAAQKYSLNGRFAEGRGTAERFLAAKFLKETRSDLATAQKKISELGKEPRKPSTENQFFGSGGRQNASPEVVSAYDSSQRLYSAWRRKYSEAKKKEVTASNILFHAVRRKKESRLTASKPQPAQTPPKYSLGGQLAPGRGTEERKAKPEPVPKYAVDAGVKTWKQAHKLGLTGVISEAPQIAKSAVDPSRNRYTDGGRAWLEEEIASRIVQRTRTYGNLEMGVRSVASQYEKESERFTEPGWSKVKKSIAQELEKYKRK